MASLLNEDYQIVLVGVNEVTKEIIPGNIISIHRTHSREELAGFYTMADVFVNPTRDEVLGMVNIEAEACGTPVITFDSGGSPECISENSGYVVECNNIAELIDKIKFVCKEKPFSSMVLGKNDEYRKMFSMCMFVFSSVALGGITAFSLVSKELLTLLGSNTSLPIGMFCFMGLYMYLEHNHGQYTSYFTMRNEIIYLKAYVISSLCIVLGSWILAVCGMNIYVLMLVHFVVQICFNNWYWPHRAMKLMNTNVIKTAQEGAVETWGLLKKLLRI